MLDDIMIYFATMLRDYCDDNKCDECPFKNVDHGYGCRIAMPAYWELKGVKK